MNFYDLLGVPSTASRDEIQTAYRRAAMKHHPDREGGDAEQFKRIQRAAEVLLDADKRAEYDRTGRDPAAGPSLTERVQAMLADVLGKLGDPDFESALGVLKSQMQSDMNTLERECATAKKQLEQHHNSILRMKGLTHELAAIAALREAQFKKHLTDAEGAIEFMRETQRILAPIKAKPMPPKRGLEDWIRV